MRRTKVIARCFGGGVAVLRVWEAGDGLVYLSAEAEFSKLEAGKEALPPIGFPAGDVFVYEVEVLNSLASARNHQVIKRLVRAILD